MKDYPVESAASIDKAPVRVNPEGIVAVNLSLTQYFLLDHENQMIVTILCGIAG
jgi:hypothetical protein